MIEFLDSVVEQVEVVSDDRTSDDQAKGGEDGDDGLLQHDVLLSVDVIRSSK